MKSLKEKTLGGDAYDFICGVVGADNVSSEGGRNVVTPKSKEEVVSIVKYVMENGGSVGTKAVELHDADEDVVFDFSKMDSIVSIDTVNLTVRVQVGCKFADIEAAVEKEGYTFGARPAGGCATVEDWVYFEKPGVGSYKYGTSKDCVYNIIAVDSNGKVIETGYDCIGYYMSGYNLIQTLSASYAMIGIITEVTLKIVPMGVIKPVAYQFENVDDMQEALMKIAQEPSVKPYHISYNETKLVMAYQGEEAFVDVDIAATDAIMEKASKIDDARSSWNNIEACACMNPEAHTLYLPLKNFADYCKKAKDISGFAIAGNVPDCSTVAVKLTGDGDFEAAADLAEDLGGRAAFRCPSTYRTADTNEYIRKITKGFLGGKPEDVNLDREVTPEIIELLKEAVGAKNVNVNGMDRIIYCHDLAPLPKEAGLAFKNIPDVIVRPETVGHIAAVLRIAYAHGIAVTPRGNATWGLGGCMPTNAGIVIDMTSKMNKVLEINAEERYVKVQAGCTWKKLLDACMKKGYIIGSYPSSFPAATIGAWISTNGMGIGSFKYGSAKDNVLNSEVIVDDGSVVITGFDNMGSYNMAYNLNQFFSGAEGTLGTIATVTFRIYPMGEIRCLGYEFDELKQANQPIQDVIASASSRPLHIAWSDYLHFQNQKRAGIHAPDVTNLWLVTLQGDAAHNDLEEALVDAYAEKANGRKVAKEIAEHEWGERCYEFRARKVGVGEIPAEVIVPAHNWGEFIDVCYEGFDVMNMEAGGIIGVMVDRSTTLFMPYYFKDDELLTGMLPFGFNFYLGDRAAEFGGRSTGLGVFFAWLLDVIHDAPTASKMREIKTVLDSHDVVNPGHVVCGSTRFGISLSKPLMSMASQLMQLIKKMFPKDTTFSDNLKRFRYNEQEHLKTLDRHHKLGDGSQ